MNDALAHRIDIGTLMPVSQAQAKPVRLEGQELQAFAKQMKSVLEGAYTTPVGPTSYGDYAQVKVGDKVVATLGNDGGAAMSNALGAQLGSTLDMNTGGPEGAQRRAEQIAKATGGEVVKMETAMSQSEWVNRTPIRTVVDFEAMKRDGLFEQWQQLGTVSAQLLAQESGT